MKRPSTALKFITTGMALALPIVLVTPVLAATAGVTQVQNFSTERDPGRSQD